MFSITDNYLLTARLSWPQEDDEWNRYRPLIGREWSHDLDTGLWLVKIDHVTWILASDWSRVIIWPSNCWALFPAGNGRWNPKKSTRNIIWGTWCSFPQTSVPCFPAYTSLRLLGWSQTSSTRVSFISLSTASKPGCPVSPCCMPSVTCRLPLSWS